MDEHFEHLDCKLRVLLFDSSTYFRILAFCPQSYDLRKGRLLGGEIISVA